MEPITWIDPFEKPPNLEYSGRASLEHWASNYVTELIAQHPDKRRKLESSLNWQLEQLESAANLDFWQQRARAAFDAKVR